MPTQVVYGPGTTPGVGGTLPAEVRQAYSAMLLKAARPLLVHAQFCDDQPIPARQGKTMQMRRFELLAPATTPLQEGVTPAGNTPIVSQVTVSVQQYGDYVQVSDVASWTTIDNVLSETADLLGEQSGQTFDVLARTFMNAGTNVLYANGRTSRITVAAGDNMTSVEIKKATRTMSTASVTRFADQCYVMIVHPFTTYNIQSISEWLAAKQYSDVKDLYMGETGELYRMRFVESPLAAIIQGAGAAGIDIYQSLAFGKRAFAKSNLEGHNLENIVHPPGSAGSADPLNQRQTSGWKGTFGGTIQNQLYVLRIEHAATA